MFLLENVTTHVATRIYFPKIKDEEVMVASSMKVEFSLALMRIHLTNLFNGNQVLGKKTYYYSPIFDIFSVKKQKYFHKMCEI